MFKVSIILPTYNRENLILATIESIRSQTYQDWELIIADDLSTDRTGEIILSIEDSRIKYFKTGTRLGIAGTRNFGMQKVTGDFIAFIDSDDLWADTKLEKQMVALSTYPDAAYCLTGGFNFRNDLEPVDYYYKQREGIKYGDLLSAFFKSEISGTTSSLIFRKQSISAIGEFNESKRFPEVDLILRLASTHKGIILYEPLLYRRLHASNASAKDWKIGYEEGIVLIKEYEDRLPRQLLKNAFYRLYMNFGEDYARHEEKINALRKFFTAWKYRPLSITPFKKSWKAIFAFKRS